MSESVCPECRKKVQLISFSPKNRNQITGKVNPQGRTIISSLGAKRIFHYQLMHGRLQQTNEWG